MKSSQLDWKKEKETGASVGIEASGDRRVVLVLSLFLVFRSKIIGPIRERWEESPGYGYKDQNRVDYHRESKRGKQSSPADGKDWQSEKMTGNV